ncbi:MerC domain-containing protein [Mucilaginibacter sp.]
MHPSSINTKLDHIGIGVSILCAIHCALLPVVITMLPLIRLKFLTHPAIELSIILTSLSIGLISLGKSWRSHQSYLPFGLLVAGFLSIAAEHFWNLNGLGWLLLVMGSILISLAHLFNWKLLRQCACNTTAIEQE